MNKKIIICSRLFPTLYGNSTETALFKICEALKKKNFKVHLLCFLDKEFTLKKKNEFKLEMKKKIVDEKQQKLMDKYRQQYYI